MKARDYLWCLLNLMQDEEEKLDRLCPRCRAEAERAQCPACGAGTAFVSGGENESFDEARFAALREGGAAE